MNNLAEAIEQLSETNPHRLQGYFFFLGAGFHVECLKMKDDGDLIEPNAAAPKEVKEQFDTLQKLHDGAYNTIQLPGRSGRWVLFVYPFAD
jgi:hypothetical protein